MSWPIPFKVIVPWHGCVGIVAYNYNHLRQVIAHKFCVGQDFCLQQLDGTLVVDEEYLKLLKPGTPLVVVPFTSWAGKKDWRVVVLLYVKTFILNKLHSICMC